MKALRTENLLKVSVKTTLMMNQQALNMYITSFILTLIHYQKNYEVLQQNLKK